MALKAGVVGAAGYAGAELIRLLLAHPEFELTVITSNADEGQPLTAVYPSFVGACDLAFTRHDNPALKECGAVFMAVPHTAAMAQAPALLEAGVSVFDLSADYRLDSVEVYEAWYNGRCGSGQTGARGVCRLLSDCHVPWRGSCCTRRLG